MEKGKDKYITDISIVIPTRNRPQSLRDTLLSIIKGECHPKQIVVVDQSDLEIADKVTEMLTNLISDYIMLTHITLQEPSITIARNTGMEHSICDIVVFCDDDVEYDLHTLREIWSMFDNDDKLALVAGVDTTSKTLYPGLIGMIFGRRPLYRFDKGVVMKGAVLGRYPSGKQKLYDTEWAMGYFFVIKKSLCMRWGIKWDEVFKSYAYAEDLDFSYRYCVMAKKEGLKTVASTQLGVRHLCSQTWRVPNDERMAMYVINRYYISWKNWHNGIYLLGVIWSDIGEVLSILFMRGNPSIIFKSHYRCLVCRHLVKQGRLEELFHMVISSEHV